MRHAKPFWDNEALQRVKQGRDPLGLEQLLIVYSHRAHLAMVRHLTETACPAIVIAGNGMYSSGRIVNYLKSMLHDPQHNVLFVGCQAQDTLGRAIQTYGSRGSYADLHGRHYDIRAQIHTIGGYSAHADQKGLVNFVTRMREWLAEVRIVHGEPGAKKQLSNILRARYQQKGQPVEAVIPGS